MTRFFWTTLVVCLFFTSTREVLVTGQEKPAVTAFVLEKIVSSPSRLPIPTGNEGVSHAIADLDGGLVRFRREHNYGKAVPCVKEYEFAWSFDRDIYVVKPGEGFGISMKGSSRHVSGECPDWITINVLFGGGKTKVMGTLPESALKRSILEAMYPQGTEGVVNVFADASPANRSTRQPTAEEVQVTFTKQMGQKDYVYVGASFSSQTNIPDYWQILYVFRAVREGESIPPRRNVIVDAPRPGRDPDSIGRSDLADNQTATDSNTTLRPTGGGTEPTAPTDSGTGRTSDSRSLPTGPTNSGATDSTASDTTNSSTRPSTTGGSGVGERDANGLPATGTPGRALIADRRLVEQGQIVHLPIFIRDPGGMANLNFDVTFDPRVAIVEGAAIQGNILQGALLQANAREIGKVRVGIAGTQGLQRTGILVTIPFRAVGTPGDVTTLSPKVTTVASADGSNLPIAEVVGEIRIAGPGGGVLGDCDGDGNLTAADALCALKMSVGLVDPRLSMDMDRDNQVTSSDARIILQQAR
ncbi:MAG TPA: cohesin domain-containing protein [Pirellulaceae bacterium]|nr:cohesin domain-containing protein [Pirellulaceae bacterium]HMO92687.1 cohesin domain-containing protein [Pirellulaceae bacterium]HMP70565.1 cohesin domain-containing protein [Pirellulaceae bacterium]